MKTACFGWLAGIGGLPVLRALERKLLLAVSGKLCYNNMKYADNRDSLSFSLRTIIHL